MKDRAKRQGFLGSQSDEFLGSMRVAIVGLGGGGSHIAQQLGHVGVGNYVLVDPDRIEESNTNRLIGGTVRDVRANRWKTVIAARQVKRVHPTARIMQVRRQWQLAADKLRDCDLIFGCLDSFGSRRQLEETARRFMIPYIDIGMDVIETAHGYAIVGQVALSMPGRACLRCMGVVRDKDVEGEARQYGAAGGKPQVVWPNGVLASVAVGIGIELMLPWHSDDRAVALLEYDGNRNSIAPSAVLSEMPAICPHFEGIAALGDPWFTVSKRT